MRLNQLLFGSWALAGLPNLNQCSFLECLLWLIISLTSPLASSNVEYHFQRKVNTMIQHIHGSGQRQTFGVGTSPRTHALNYAAKCCRSCLWSDPQKRRGGKVTDRGEHFFFRHEKGKRAQAKHPDPTLDFVCCAGGCFFVIISFALKLVICLTHQGAVEIGKRAQPACLHFRWCRKKFIPFVSYSTSCIGQLCVWSPRILLWRVACLCLFAFEWHLPADGGLFARWFMAASVPGTWNPVKSPFSLPLRSILMGLFVPTVTTGKASRVTQKLR